MQLMSDGYRRYIIKPGALIRNHEIQDRTNTHFWSQTDDLSPPPPSKFRTNRPTYPRPQHLPLIVQQHRSIIIKSNKPAIWRPHRFFRPHDHRATYVASTNFDGGGRGCGEKGDGSGTLDDADNLIADSSPAVVDFVLEDVDTFDEQRSRVVDDLRWSFQYKNGE